MKEQQSEPLRVIIIQIIDPAENRFQAEQEGAELVRLIDTLRGMVVVKILQKRGRPSANMYLGSGKAHEVAGLAKHLRADVVIANAMLKPTQLHNLRRIIPVPVWDRVDVILKIFEHHAQTQEAKWQVELARLRHEFPRLYGKGIDLSQIVGGKKGYTRGPGEKLLELQKRHLRRRIDTLEKKLENLKKVRATQREARTRQNFFNVAIVGYTNAGKSSLLVALTKKRNVYVADELFATLDTRIGTLYLGDWRQKVIVSDTIGFLRALPPHLISSFLATLEEAVQADLLVHVVDASDPEAIEKAEVVGQILATLGIGEKPTLYVLNKIDVAHPDHLQSLRNFFVEHKLFAVSTRTGEGLEPLKEEIRKMVEKRDQKTFLLKPAVS